MTFLIIVMHIIACLGLIGIILVQRGRGGGLVESFSGLDSIFGTRTSAFLTKLTTVLAITFFFTCLALTFLSLQQSKSLMRHIKTAPAPIKVKEAVTSETQAPLTEPAKEQQALTKQPSPEQKGPSVGSVPSAQEKTALEQKPILEEKPLSEQQPQDIQFPRPRKGELK